MFIFMLHALSALLEWICAFVAIIIIIVIVMSEKHKKIESTHQNNHISREFECSSFQYILLKFH